MAKKKEFYKQCVLQKPTEKGYEQDVVFIPENLAKVGKVVYLTDTPDELWTVKSVGERHEHSLLLTKEKSNRRFGASAGLGCEV